VASRLNYYVGDIVISDSFTENEGRVLWSALRATALGAAHPLNTSPHASRQRRPRLGAGHRPQFTRVGLELRVAPDDTSDFERKFPVSIDALADRHGMNVATAATHAMFAPCFRSDQELS
jgi:hypothetical protein